MIFSPPIPPLASLEPAVILAVLAPLGLGLGLMLMAALAFRRSGGLYEAWLRLRVRLGDLETAAAYFRSRQRHLEAAELLVRIGDLEEAARLYVTAGRPELAAAAFESAGDLRTAALYFRHAGDAERAADCYRRQGDSERAVRLMTEEGDFGAAAEELFRLGRTDEAVALLRERERTRDAARLLIRAGRIGDAAVILLAADQPGLAAELFARAGDLPRAAEALEAAGRFRDAALAFLDLGDTERAAGAYVAASDPEEAARILEVAGYGARAAEILEFAGDRHRAAQLRLEEAERAGGWEDAAEHLLVLGRLEEAVERFKRAGKRARAGEVLVRLGRSAEGAKLLAEGGLFAEAAAAYAEVGDERRAAALYLKAGRIDAALRCFRVIGDQLTIARVHVKLGALEAAQRALGEIGADDPRYREASEMRAQLYERQGDVGKAREILQTCLEIHGLSAETVDLACRVAEYEGRMGLANEALERLRALEAKGLAPPGFEARLAAFRRSILVSAPGGAGAQAGPARRAKGGTSITMGFPGLDRYDILARLGAGSFGEVYRAQDRSLDREVAIKILRATDIPRGEARSMFLQEARLVARLNHPNIITVYDIGDTGDSLYIAMEFVDGETLADVMERQRRPLQASASASLARQIAQGLDYAHERGIVHRDIKLENIMLTRDGRAKILDFGVAKLLDDQSEVAPVMAGTPLYMAPEQVTFSGVDGRTDIYALGVLLYCLSTARFPFVGENVLEKQRFETPVPPELHNPGMDPSIAEIIHRCLEKDPAARYQSAREIVAVLQGRPRA